MPRNEPHVQESARERCAMCQAVTDAGKPTTCPECPERIREEQAEQQAMARERIRDACKWSRCAPVM